MILLGIPKLSGRDIHFRFEKITEMNAAVETALQGNIADGRLRIEQHLLGGKELTVEQVLIKRCIGFLPENMPQAVIAITKICGELCKLNVLIIV